MCIYIYIYIILHYITLHYVAPTSSALVPLVPKSPVSLAAVWNGAREIRGAWKERRVVWKRTEETSAPVKVLSLPATGAITSSASLADCPRSGSRAPREASLERRPSSQRQVCRATLSMDGVTKHFSTGRSMGSPRSGVLLSTQATCNPSSSRMERSTRQRQPFSLFKSEWLSIAYITNPWAPAEETTGPHRVTK